MSNNYVSFCFTNLWGGGDEGGRYLRRGDGQTKAAHWQITGMRNSKLDGNLCTPQFNNRYRTCVLPPIKTPNNGI